MQIGAADPAAQDTEDDLALPRLGIVHFGAGQHAVLTHHRFHVAQPGSQPAG
jgi:hypothetical protein